MSRSAGDVLGRLQVARAQLHAADPVIAGLIDRRPDYDPRRRLDGIPPMDLFGALVFQVTGQQLSVASRRRILDRIQEMFGGHLPSPAEVLRADPAGLRQAGLSGRKVSTVRDLAERLTDGRLNIDALSALPDEEIIAELTKVPGIGPWTVQGALILGLNREDVVLPGDLALRKAVRDAYQLDHLPTPDEVLAIAERWRPYRSLATLYLFRAGESTAAVNRSVPALDDEPGCSTVCKNPQVDINGPAVAELMAGVAAAVGRHVPAVSEDVYTVILGEIPELRADKPVLALLASSVQSNVGTCLQIMQHQIDLSAVEAPAAALEYARRRAQRGTPLTALLRAYRLGHTCFSDWLLKELARQADDAAMITAATLCMSKIVAGYVDQTSEEIVAAYTRERENWLRNRSAARAARIRDLLSGRRINVSATEAALGYRLRQYHVGLVCWADEAAAAADSITQLEHAISHVAMQAACPGDPVFLPRDECSAWAWLPLGIRDTFDAATAITAAADTGVHFAFGGAARGAAGFRLTHRQAVAAQAVALAAGPPAPQAVAFSEVAPVAMMLGSADLLRAWVLSTLAGLAVDDEHHARLRDTLLVFLQTGGSYKATAERLMLHKNTIQYRIRKAEESLGRPIGENRPDVELALRASHWLGSSVL